MTKLYITDSMVAVRVVSSQANDPLSRNVDFVVIIGYVAWIARAAA